MSERIERPAVFRVAQITERAKAADGPTIYRAVMSTDAPVEMPFGREILDHSPECVDLSFAERGAPVYVNHDRDDHVGVITGLQLRGGQIEVAFRFGRSARAQEIEQDLQDGIRNYVSVGYQVEKYKRERDESGTEVLRAVRWRPHEVSIVGVPADESAVVIRSAEYGTRAVEVESPEQPAMPEGEKMSDEKPTPAPEPVVRDNSAAIRGEAAEIVRMAVQHGMTDKAQAWIDAGRSASDVAKEILAAQAKNLKPAANDPMQDMSDKERKQYNIRNLILSQDANVRNPRDIAGFELEVSDEMARTAEHRRGGVFVPFGALQSRALIAATASIGGNLVFTEPQSFIEILRNRTVVGTAGARFLTGLSGPIAFPRQITAGAASWRTENPGSDLSDTDSTFDQLTMSPKLVQRNTAWSRQFMVQSSQDVENMVRDDLAQVLAIAVDLAALQGGGSNEPSGVLASTSTSTVTLGSAGATVTLASLVGLERAVAASNADRGTLAYVTHPVQREKARQVQYFSGTNGIPLWSGGPGLEGQILAPTGNGGYRGIVSTQVPTNLTKGTSTTICSAWVFGNWEELIVGTWGPGFEVVVDPYSKKKQALIEITAYLMADAGLRHPASFAVIKDAL